MGQHNFLSIRDFTPEEIRYLLDLAREMKAHPSAHMGALKGKTLAMIFEKPSLRIVCNPYIPHFGVPAFHLNEFKYVHDNDF